MAGSHRENLHPVIKARSAAVRRIPGKSTAVKVHFSMIESVPVILMPSSKQLRISTPEIVAELPTIVIELLPRDPMKSHFSTVALFPVIFSWAWPLRKMNPFTVTPSLGPVKINVSPFAPSQTTLEPTRLETRLRVGHDDDLRIDTAGPVCVVGSDLDRVAGVRHCDRGCDRWEVCRRDLERVGNGQASSQDSSGKEKCQGAHLLHDGTPEWGEVVQHSMGERGHGASRALPRSKWIHKYPDHRWGRARAGRRTKPLLAGRSPRMDQMTSSATC